MNNNNNIHFTALNEIAHAHVRHCIAAIDQRLSIDTYDLIVVVADAMAQNHLPSFKLVGQVKATDALVAAGVLGRVDMRSNFFVKDAFKPSYEAVWATVGEEIADGACHVMSKSNTAYRTRSAAKMLKVEDVRSMENRKCYFARLVDMENVVAAFDDPSPPVSVRFLTCEHLAATPERVNEWMDFLRAQCAATGTRMAEIGDGWLVVSDCKQFLLTLNNATIRFWNSASKRFALTTRMDYDREVTSYGVYE